MIAQISLYFSYLQAFQAKNQQILKNGRNIHIKSRVIAPAIWQSHLIALILHP